MKMHGAILISWRYKSLEILELLKITNALAKTVKRKDAADCEHSGCVLKSDQATRDASRIIPIWLLYYTRL